MKPLKAIQTMEGKTRLLVPTVETQLEKHHAKTTKPEVFYNPKAKLSRDIGVLFVAAILGQLSDEVSVCEPLAGCGARGLRYANETNLDGQVALNDYSPHAYSLIKRNIRLNRLQNVAVASPLEANLLLIERATVGRRFDFIDIDPFGSPLPYIYSALSAVKKKGYIALTATDTAALTGAAPRTCVRRYAAAPLHTEYKHEAGLRILLATVARGAAQNDFKIEPLVTHSTQHYFRVYVRLAKGASAADSVGKDVGYIVHCPSCLWREARLGTSPPLPETCPTCNRPCQRGGPLWCGTLVDKTLLNNMLDNSLAFEETYTSAIKLLKVTREEANLPPTFFNIDLICKIHHVSSPPIAKIREALLDSGFRAARTHFHPKGLKTDASPKDIAEAAVSLIKAM